MEDEKKENISIKFSKKNMSPFTDKGGNELVSIKVPNADPEDRRPWEEFVLQKSWVKEDKYSKKCMFAYIPADGTTILTRSIRPETPDGEWTKEKRKISNQELKQLLSAPRVKERGPDVR